MKILLLTPLLLLACNYYGPGNPPPPDPQAVIKIHHVDAASRTGVEGALCPNGSELVGGGCDCWVDAPNCANSSAAAMAVCTPSGNGMIGVCFSGCGGVEVHALCESAANATVTQGLSAPDVEFEAALDKYQKAQH